MNLVESLEKSSRQYPDQTAIVEGANRICYGDLFALVKEVAVDLKASGIREGDLIGLRLPNSIAYIALTYALWETRAVVVPIAMELKDSEVELLTNTMGVHGVISSADRSGAGTPIVRPFPGKECYFDEKSGSAGRMSPSGETAFIRFTSGTTESYKGVVLSHNSISERIRAVNRGLGMGPGDTVIWNLSMAHHFVSTIVLYLDCSVKVVLAQGILAGSILDAVEEEQATVLYMSPFHFSLLAADTSGRRLGNIRLAISTATGLPKQVYADFFDRFQIPIRQAYGIIEVGLSCINTSNPIEKRGSVGRVIPGYEIDIRNTADYPGEIHVCGNIFVRGPGFFDAYYSPFRDASNVLDDGWFDTGDIGWLDENGYLYLLGRKKELINVAGMKVFPQEVEAVINLHPAVMESRVRGRRHPKHGETVLAEIVTENMGSLTEKEIKALCHKKLASYKVPEEIRFVKQIEKTAVTHKITRFLETENE